jgi:hypothetical protein
LWIDAPQSCVRNSNWHGLPPLSFF